jgi:hypothetical protein
MISTSQGKTEFSLSLGAPEASRGTDFGIAVDRLFGPEPELGQTSICGNGERASSTKIELG